MASELLKLRAGQGEQTITVHDRQNPIAIARQASAFLHCPVTLVDPDDDEEMLTIEVI